MKKLLILLTLLSMPLAAQEITLPEPGSVSIEEGLAAWSRAHDVFSHPRCANCHVGADHIPMWSGPSYGEARPHGMNINAGESRIGAEAVLCSTCHGLRNSPVPHGPPGADATWMLAPVEAAWFGKTSKEICLQLKDPDLNGGRDFVEIAEHLGHDLILHWAWDPGPGREPAPGDLQTHIDNVLAWGVAGMPCPAE